jgi:hypothetical protein
MRWLAGLLALSLCPAASSWAPTPDPDDTPGEDERRGARGGRGGLVTATLRCRCGATIHAAGNPAVGVAILRHGDDPRALAFYDDDPLLARALAGDPALPDEPVVRDWLSALHPTPGAPPAA